MPLAPVNGVHLYYEIAGKGRPVVFIHGVGVTSRVWEFQKPLTEQFKMITYDLRGSGKSGKSPELEHTAEMFSQDLKLLLDYLGFKRVSIVGLSLGCAIAMKFAIDYPERVDRLVLSGAFSDLTGVLYLASRYFSSVIGRVIMYKPGGEAATKIMLPSVSLKECLYYHTNIIKIDADEVKKYGQILNSYSITPALEKIKAPTLVLYGSYEPLLKRYGKVITRYVENSYIKIIPGVGHGWNGEKPELFNRIVGSFLQGE